MDYDAGREQRTLWTPDNGFADDGGCVVRRGMTYEIDSHDKLELLPSCDFQHGSSFSFRSSEASDDPPKPSKAVAKKRPTSLLKDDSMDAGTSAVALPASPADAVAQAQTAAAGAAAQAKATVGAVDAVDLKQVLPAGTDGNSGFGVVLALIAVAGGGAAWKFYNNFSKQKHEEAMERMKLDAQKQDDNRKHCDTSSAAAMAKIGELEGKLAKLPDVAAYEERIVKLEKQASKLSLSAFDPDELEERLVKLEKKLKRATEKDSDAA